jgi:hypothetical protein
MSITLIGFIKVANKTSVRAKIALAKRGAEYQYSQNK